MPAAKPARAEVVGGRERVLREAARLFAAKGYAATSVRDVLRAADVTAPVLYYHFGSKEGVFLELVREGVEQLQAAVEETLRRGGSAADRIRRYCRAVAAVRRKHADTAWIVAGILAGPGEAAPRFDFRGLIRTLVRRLEGLVREGVRSGEFRKCEPLHATLALLGAVEIATRPRMFAAVFAVDPEQLDGILSVILEGLASPPASKALRGGGARRRSATGTSAARRRRSSRTGQSSAPRRPSGERERTGPTIGRRKGPR